MAGGGQDVELIIQQQARRVAGPRQHHPLIETTCDSIQASWTICVLPPALDVCMGVCLHGEGPLGPSTEGVVTREEYGAQRRGRGSMSVQLERGVEGIYP